MTDSKFTHDQPDDLGTPSSSDEFWIDGLLRHHYQHSTAHREDLLAKVRTQLRSNTPIAAPQQDEAPSRGKRTRRSVGRWIALAASLAVVWVILFAQGPNFSTNSAQAAVLESLAVARDALIRQFAVSIEWQGPLPGRPPGNWNFYHRGPDSFVVHRPGRLPRLTALWCGGNGEEVWMVPSVGPVVVGKGGSVSQRIEDVLGVAPDQLQLSIVLERMAEFYELTEHDRVTLPDPETEGNSVLCRSISGTAKDLDKRWPQIIRLWADAQTSEVQRLELEWDESDGTIQPRRVLLEYRGIPDVPEDFFEHTGHHVEGRPILELWNASHLHPSRHNRRDVVAVVL